MQPQRTYADPAPNQRPASRAQAHAWLRNAERSQDELRKSRDMTQRQPTIGVREWQNKKDALTNLATQIARQATIAEMCRTYLARTEAAA